MSELQTSEADGSATTNGGETGAAKADNAPAVPGSSEMKSRNLATQLEEKIIRQVEVQLLPRAFDGNNLIFAIFCSTILGIVIFQGTSSFSQLLQTMREDVSLLLCMLNKS